MPLFSKNVEHFGFLTNEMFNNKVIVVNATSVLIFQYKNARKTTFKYYYTIGRFQLLQRQICERNR